MGRVLRGEARDRARASTMWFVAGMLVVIVLLMLWGSFVGFAREVELPVRAVVSEARQLTVTYSHDGCQQPERVEVVEEDDAVTLVAWVSDRRPWLTPDCDAALTHREQVSLREPLGERELRSGTRAG